jgi:hypothetical protein
MYGYRQQTIEMPPRGRKSLSALDERRAFDIRQSVDVSGFTSGTFDNPCVDGMAATHSTACGLFSNANNNGKSPGL